MASENLIPIPGRLHSVATEGHVAGADEIYDDTQSKLQSTINTEISTALGNTLNKTAQTLTTAEKDQVATNLINKDATNGMARIELKATDNFKTVVEAQTGGNVVFVIKYNFTLSGNTTIPANCILDFQGGSLSGAYTLTGQNTLLSGNIKCLVTIAGTFANNYLDITWFGAVGDDNTDNTNIVNNLIVICKNSKCNLYIPKGIFAIKTGFIKLGREEEPSSQDIDADSSFISYNNITIFGDGKDSIIKSYYLADNLNMYYVKDVTIRDIHITSGIIEKQSSDGGTNTISVVNGKNIQVINVFASNAYYKAHTSPSEAYYDGGKGLTFQGRIFENILVKGFYAENCAHGIDLECLGDAFLYDPKSYVLFDDVVVNKCAIGVYLSMDPNAVKANNDNQIVNGLISVNARTTNCLQALRATTLCGANINVQNVSDESVDNLLLNNYGRPWLDTNDYSNVPRNMIMAYSALIYTCEKCNINVSSYAKEQNYAYRLVGSYNFGNKQITCKDNILTLSINNNVNIVKVKNAEEITDEEKLLVSAQDGQLYYFKNSTFIINGCGNTINDFKKFFEVGYGEANLIIILDGIPYMTSETTQELYIAAPWMPKNVRVKYTQHGALFENLSSSDGEYSIFGTAKPHSSDLMIAFNGNGDIVRPSVTTAPSATNISSILRGGAGIPVRDSSNVFNIIGYIPVDVKATKGTTRPTLSATNAGFCFFDTNQGVNKPIWWTGSAWVDATGATV